MVTLLRILKILFSIDIKFWKTPSTIFFQNLGSFQGKYLWPSSNLAEALSLRFTLILLMVLKIMILQNFTEEHSKLSQTSKMEHFAKIVKGKKTVNYFYNKLHLRCLTGSWIRLCFIMIIWTITYDSRPLLIYT